MSPFSLATAAKFLSIKNLSRYKVDVLLSPGGSWMKRKVWKSSKGEEEHDNRQTDNFYLCKKISLQQLTVQLVSLGQFSLLLVFHGCVIKLKASRFLMRKVNSINNWNSAHSSALRSMLCRYQARIRRGNRPALLSWVHWIFPWLLLAS